MLDNPIEILRRLNKQELQMVDEFVKGAANTYVVSKMRKTQYKLQKLYLVATYEDKETQEWHMLMPAKLTPALSTSLNFYLDTANKGVKAPSAKQLRMMSALGQFLGGKELWWHLYDYNADRCITTSCIVCMQYRFYSDIGEGLESNP